MGDGTSDATKWDDIAEQRKEKEQLELKKKQTLERVLVISNQLETARREKRKYEKLEIDLTKELNQLLGL